MPKKKVSLLERAEVDLRIAKQMLPEAGDEVMVDACAYHCQQCAEKIVKYLILLEGKMYANDHRSDMYLDDLEDGEIKTLAESVAYRIDNWATHIRYSKTLLSSRKAVQEVITVCEEMYKLALLRSPKVEDI